ncbi:MAG: Gfo/Idh/MocA family oxidoreductase [Candidatus Marinimicrobia bacterium]|nr:Gfo/Idh/MocA family oxidoreductase [Candidatus Neomarinimicrobiota bacterium]
MKVVIVGCGNIGVKRINAIQNIPEIEIVGLVEVNQQQIKYLQENYKFPISDNYQKYLIDNSIDAFIVSATTQPSLKIIEDALIAGKHVLCEKPLGNEIAQTEKITSLANEKSLILHIGFNIRYDEGLQKAKLLIEEGKIGKPYFFKCTYVNGSVVTNNNKVGALLDMGIHNIYLAKMFMGDINPIASAIQRFEYDVKDRDDNGFVLLQSDSMVGSIHFSLVRWKNDFKLEVTGSDGSVIVENLTKWGTQTTIHHERVYPSGVPKEKMYTYNGDNTWEVECHDFYNSIIENDLSKNNEAREAMEIIEKIKLISK